MQVLQLGAAERVLEVGTGSGYQTAVLGQLAGHVYSIERVRELSARARSVLDDLRVNNVALFVGDGSVGWSRYSPYDGILVTAGAPTPPQALLDQLADGGRMLIPIGDRKEQRLTLFRKGAAGVETEEIASCTFVPLLGRFAWAE
jgi:protein-L-isoaspartate(D-aspartate) O-methyltransferase